MRRFQWFVALVLIAFGVLSAHYTVGEDIAHHGDWADRYNLPKPSFEIFLIGIASTILGSVSAGWLLGRPRKR